MKRILFAILLLFSISVSGQELCNIKGILKNRADSLSVPYSTLIITSNTNLKRNFQILTDSGGCFMIKLPEDHYKLDAYYMGEKYLIAKDVNVKGAVKDLGNLYIALSITKLKEVVVTAQRPFIKYEQDKTLINMAANSAMEKGSVADGLTKIPGIGVSSQGTLSLYGMQTISIYIDDRPSNMTQEQLLSYLSSLSVNDVDVLELINSPGARYGKNVQAVLNIKTKRRSQDGVNGFLTASGEYFKLLSGSVSGRLNMNKGISKNFLSYHFSDYQRLYNTEIDYLPKDPSSYKNKFNLSEEDKLSPRKTHWVNIGSDLSLTDRSVLGVKLSLGKSDNLFKNTSTLDKLSGSVSSKSVIDMDYKTLMSNIYYAYTGSKMKWINNMDYSKNKVNRTGSYATGSTQEIDENYDFYRLSSEISAEVFPKFSIFSGISVDFNRMNTSSTVVDHKSGYSYNENNAAAYLSASYKYGEWFISSGLRLNREKSWGEFGKYQIDTSFIIPQPSLLISKDFGKKHQVRFSYNRSYTRPNFRDMVPFDSYTGSFVNRVGNPKLQVSKEDLFSLSYSFLRAAMVELSYSHTKNPIVENITESGSKIVIRKDNLDQSNYLRFLIALPVPYINKNKNSWVGTTYFAIQRQHDKGSINFESFSNSFTAYYVQHVESVSLSSGWYLDAKATYYSSLSYGLYNMQNQWWIDASISKTIDDFRIALSASDIFNTNKAVGLIDTNLSSLRFTKNWNYPSIKLSITYNFGRSKLNTYKNRNGLIKDTQRINTNPDQGVNPKGTTASEN